MAKKNINGKIRGKIFLKNEFVVKKSTPLLVNHRNVNLLN